MSAFNKAWLFLKQYGQTDTSPQENQQGSSIPIDIQQYIDRMMKLQMEYERLRQQSMRMSRDIDLNAKNYIDPATK